MKAAIRRFVRRRAGNRCEYCRMHQADDPILTFHVEHIIARQHRGSDKLSNLAWRRRQRWHRHFRWLGARIVGRTKTGKATVHVLDLNAAERVAVRAALLAAGLFSPN